MSDTRYITRSKSTFNFSEYRSAGVVVQLGSVVCGQLLVGNVGQHFLALIEKHGTVESYMEFNYPRVLEAGGW